MFEKNLGKKHKKHKNGGFKIFFDKMNAACKNM